jgi:hypothetical protein
MADDRADRDRWFIRSDENYHSIEISEIFPLKIKTEIKPEMYIPGLTERVEYLEKKVEELLRQVPREIAHPIEDRGEGQLPGR